MKVLGIYTGRPKSTTEWMIKTALKGAQEEGAEVTLINIRDWDLKPCTGCNVCLMHLMSGKGPFCMHKDDGAKIGDMIIEADGLIVAAPLYEKLPPSEYKVLNDRMGPGCDVAVLGMSNKTAIEAGHPENCVPERTFITRPVSFIAHGGSEWTTLGLPAMSMFAISHGMKIADLVEIPWDTMAIFDDVIIERLKDSGRNIARNCGKAEEEMTYIGEAGHCPICHNKAMVLPEEGTEVICAVCGMHGELTIEGGNIKVSYPPEQLKLSHMTLTGKIQHGIDLGKITEQIEAMDKEEMKRRKTELLSGIEVTKP